MSHRSLKQLIAGLLMLVGPSTGCGGPSVHSREAVAAADKDELNGPVDHDWDRWLAPPPEDQPRPRFVCEKPVYSLDRAWEGSTIEQAWEISNIGHAPLRLQLWA